MGWLFARHVDPLDRPPPLDGGCGEAAGMPVPPRARVIQHDAENVLAFVKGRNDLAARRALRNLDVMTEAETGQWTRPEGAND